MAQRRFTWLGLPLEQFAIIDMRNFWHRSNPAHAVRGPKYVVKKGKTPVLNGEEARAILESIDTSLAGRPARIAP